jgi:Glycosyl transferase family 2
MFLNNGSIMSYKRPRTIKLSESSRTSVGKTVLFANVRDEKNMKEWVAHHLINGFDLIYIFDHKSKNLLSQELSCFKKKVVVERCEMEGPIKMQLMMKAAKIASSAGADWMLYLDADEFLVLNAFSNIKEMLKYYLFSDSLAINWLMFGTSFHKTNPPTGLLIENYIKSDLKLDKHVKTFVRPSQVIAAITPHYFVIADSGRMISLNMKPMRETKSFNDWDVEYEKCAAFIAHYVYQSEECYIQRKIILPRDDNSEFRQVEQNIHEKHNFVYNPIVKKRYAEKIKQFLKNL